MGETVTLLRAFVVAVPALVGCQQTVSWQGIQQKIADDFPQVPTVTIDEFLALDRDSLLIIDARSLEEYGVSHLENAVRSENAEAVIALARGRGNPPVIVYCSVGYRSARLADDMRRKGYADVKNLEGSIFEWANRGMPVHAAGGVTDVVHPFDDTWGVLLDSRYHPKAD